jgi:site-specific DNA recombinase
MSDSRKTKSTVTRRTPPVATSPTIQRCAIYTRKSTEEGLKGPEKQEFNTLDAQREAGEAYVQSQRREGWEASPVRYDDGGFSGANIERPALQRLLKDIESGQIDVVVVYKIDRLSRSLMDFAKLMELFERHHVSLVSVTQQLNTSTSLGRLVLNILFSFAQFEREMISERTQDKMRAARRKGRWIGGTVPFGYDAVDKKLVVNEAEAQQVKALFEMYLEEHSTMKVLEQANAMGWRTKSWVTKQGKVHRGGRWTKSILGRLLNNPVYAGKVEVEGATYPALHAPLIDEVTFSRVEKQLAAGRSGRDPVARNLHGFLLRGLVRCVACESTMITATGQSRGKDYRYYTCLAVKQRGTTACPVRNVSAEALEDFVIDRIREVAKSPALVADTVTAVAAEQASRAPALETERRHLEQELARSRAETRTLIERLADSSGDSSNAITARLGELEIHVAELDARLDNLGRSLATMRTPRVTAKEIADALVGFDEIWDGLTVNERIRVVALVIEGIAFDGRAETISVTYSPTGLALLHEEVGAATTGKGVA